MTRCYFLIGPPASGKSSWIARNRFLLDPVVISSDDYSSAEAARLGLSYHDYVKQMDYQEVVKRLSTKMVEAVMRSAVIVIDQTNCSVKDRKLFRRFIPASYETIGVVFEWREEVLRERLARRESQTGKHVPTYVLEQKMRSFMHPLPHEFDHVLINPLNNIQDISEWLAVTVREQ